MKTWTVLALALGLQISVYATEENVHSFRAIDPDQLDDKYLTDTEEFSSRGGRENNIDPLILAAISLCVRVRCMEE